MAMTKDQHSAATAAYAKDPTIGARKVMNASGCTRFAADAFLKTARTKDVELRPLAKGTILKPEDQTPAYPPTKWVNAVGKPDATAMKGISVKEFKGRFDFEAKLRRTIKELCKDQFVSDADVREHCDIPIPAFRSVADLPEFKACQIKDRGTVFWSVKENVDEVRQQARKWGISK
jgi:hypothetical protein